MTPNVQLSSQLMPPKQESGLSCYRPKATVHDGQSASSLPQRHRKELSSRRKRRTSSDLGLWKVQWLHCVNRPQATGPSPWHSRTPQDAATHSTLQTAPHEVQPKSCTCRRQEPDHRWWASVSNPDSADVDLINNTTAFPKQTIEILPATTHKLREIREAQKADEVLHQVREYCIQGWPVYIPENSLLKQYWFNREQLTIVDDLLLLDDHLVIPRCSANFNGNRVKNHPQPWTCPIKVFGFVLGDRELE